MSAVAPLALLIAALGPIIRQFVISPQTAANAVVMAKQDTTGSRAVPEIKMAGGSYEAAVEAQGFRTVPPAANP